MARNREPDVDAATRDRWWRGRANGRPTHVLRWTPTFEVEVVIAPWEDPNEVLVSAPVDWEKNFAAYPGVLEPWTEVARPADFSIRKVRGRGSRASIEKKPKPKRGKR